MVVLSTSTTAEEATEKVIRRSEQISNAYDYGPSIKDVLQPSVTSVVLVVRWFR